MVIGKLKAMIQVLRGDVIAFAPLKGMMVKFTGNGTGNPTIVTGYNVLTVIRTGVGIYNVTPIQDTVFGTTIEQISTFSTGFNISSSTTSDAHFVRIVPGAGTTFDIIVTEMTQGSGNRIDFIPFDIQSADIVSGNIFLNLGDGDILPA